MRLRRFGLAIAIVAATALIPSSALATFHEVSIREVFPGDSTSPEAQYVELQSYSPGQNLVDGHMVWFYNAEWGESRKQSLRGETGERPRQHDVPDGDPGCRRPLRRHSG